MKTQDALLLYGGFCVGMAALSRVLPPLPDALVPVFNVLQRLNALYYLPDSPALLALTNAQSTQMQAVPGSGAGNTYTLPEVTITA